jgi:hypothetical protein
MSALKALVLADKGLNVECIFSVVAMHFSISVMLGECSEPRE